ncbi:exosome complex component Rrp41 [Phanerochaete sordida]|uniref:Exosome complex component Rrp41 n=1 Tax=Phanerochaete sordida TaxID=48140 RepID=A0A9P3FY98_9APHY|nr:exosome complex component Rrp41 [Phanerochaete sordida]
MAHPPTRRDGRSNDELRPVTITYDGLDRVDGSARFGFGQTQALASLSGPIEVRPNHESPSHATLEVHVRPLASVPGTDSRALAATLKAVLAPAILLAQHPRTLIQIVGQALCGSESGSGLGSTGRGWNASLVASLVNACSAALINAGSVPMNGVVCAVSVGRIPDPSNSASFVAVLDPSEAELASLEGGGCFVYMFSSTLPPSTDDEEDIPQSSLLWTNYTATSGVINDEEFAEAKSLAFEGAEEVWRLLKNSIKPGHLASPESASKRDVKTKEEPPSGEDDDSKMEI